MEKTEFKRRPYIRPKIKVLEVDDEKIICTTMQLNPGSSDEEDWDNEDMDGGEVEV